MELIKSAAADALNKDGFLFAPSLIDKRVCADLADSIGANVAARNARHLIDHPNVQALIASSSLSNFINTLLGNAAFAFKATLFDKNVESNWLVAWHQDVAIPVSHRHDCLDWRAWSVKDGVDYVQPPDAVLAGIVALRLNLDACDHNNGPLRILAKSHLVGRVKEVLIGAEVSRYQEHAVTGEVGDCLAMRPLTIHASSKSVTPSRRRVLHLEFANFDLPEGLDWHRRVALRFNPSPS